MIKKLKVYLRPVELSRLIKKLKFFIIFINGGILSLTDSHHNHHGQKPTMVGICHGGNVPVSHHHHHHHRHQDVIGIEDLQQQGRPERERNTAFKTVARIYIR